MPWDVRRAGSRAVTSTDWLHSAHSFAFGSHYDPDNLSFGSLQALNVDELQPGEGYPRHRHAGVEILTWVLSGVFEHVDASGSRLVRPGTLQCLSAGSGIEHTERSGSPVEPVRVVQMWLAPAGPAGEPSYQAVPIDRPAGGLVLAAAGGRPAPVSLRRPGAELYLGRLPAGATVSLPAGPVSLPARPGSSPAGPVSPPAAQCRHLFLTAGVITVRDDAGAAEQLAAEDALRVTGARPVRVTAERDAELLVWAMGPAQSP